MDKGTGLLGLTLPDQLLAFDGFWDGAVTVFDCRPNEKPTRLTDSSKPMATQMIPVKLKATAKQKQQSKP